MVNSVDAKCMDCGKLYENFGLDTTLPHNQWLMINPDDHGLLCANCIVLRAAKLPSITAMRAVFDISPSTVSAA